MGKGGRADWCRYSKISTFGEWNCAFQYYDLLASASYLEGFTIRLQLFIFEMRREKWCCFSERSSNLLTIANCYLYCKTNNEDNEVLWGYFVVTAKLPHACRSYSSFWIIKTFKRWSEIRHFHISHNAPYLSPQILHNRLRFSIRNEGHFQFTWYQNEILYQNEDFIHNENWNDLNWNEMLFGYHVNKYREIHGNWMTSF